jgi:hypothetical protein
MRCSLSFQVVSGTTRFLIDNYADQCGGAELYAPLRCIVVSCDRLVDIMNARRDKGCSRIDSPNHPHLNELESILKTFAEWEQDAASHDSPESFLPWTMSEDIKWLCLSTIGLAKFYLKEDNSRVMAQDRSGSDVCEHHFANVKSKNPNPTAADANNATSKSTAVRAHTFAVGAKTNTAGSKLYRSEITQPLSKPPK